LKEPRPYREGGATIVGLSPAGVRHRHPNRRTPPSRRPFWKDDDHYHLPWRSTGVAARILLPVRHSLRRTVFTPPLGSAMMLPPASVFWTKCPVIHVAFESK
jgi:hypothetical protein